MLRGTVHDPLWRMAAAPDYIHKALNPGPDGSIIVTNVGFIDPAYAGWHSLSLRIQTSFLEVDRDADYYLFAENRPSMRFEIPEEQPHTKLMFRLFRTDILMPPPTQPRAIEAIAEHLVLHAAHLPGLSREWILAQLSLEYGVDVEAKLVAFQRLNLGGGQRLPNESFLDFMGKNMHSRSRTPILNNIHSKV